MSLHMSKCHIVENHMPLLNYATYLPYSKEIPGSKMANQYPAVIFLELISRDNILLCHLSKNSYLMKSVQEPLC